MKSKQEVKSSKTKNGPTKQIKKAEKITKKKNGVINTVTDLVKNHELRRNQRFERIRNYMHE